MIGDLTDENGTLRRLCRTLVDTANEKTAGPTAQHALLYIAATARISKGTAVLERAAG